MKYVSNVENQQNFLNAWRRTIIFSYLYMIAICVLGFFVTYRT